MFLLVFDIVDDGISILIRISQGTILNAPAIEIREMSYGLNE